MTKQLRHVLTAVTTAIAMAIPARAQNDDPVGLPTPSYYLKAERVASRTVECDIAIYGGTPAGVTAAISSGL